jgi:GLPGLI family protein
MIDSGIKLVAFYTDDIPVSGRPESFNGLTGMILQVADMISCAQTKKNKNSEKKYNDIDDGDNRTFFLWAKQ